MFEFLGEARRRDWKDPQTTKLENSLASLYIVDR